MFTHLMYYVYLYIHFFFLIQSSVVWVVNPSTHNLSLDLFIVKFYIFKKGQLEIKIFENLNCRVHFENLRKDRGLKCKFWEKD